MALANGVTPGDLERGKFREGAAAGSIAVAVTGTDGVSLNGGKIFTLPYDYVVVTYPDGVTEVYTTKSGGAGGAVQQVVTIVYTDSTKANISTVTRT